MTWNEENRSGGAPSVSSLLNISTSHSKTSCAGPPLFLTIRYVLTEDFKIFSKCFISSDRFMAIFLQHNLKKLIPESFSLLLLLFQIPDPDLIFVDNGSNLFQIDSDLLHFVSVSDPYSSRGISES